MGTLRINGKIRIAQFWPQGSADADTTQLEFDVTKTSFEFAEDDVNFEETSVYNESFVSGRGGKKKVIKEVKKDNSQKISIRLQGIDAPELHYKAPPLKRSPEITDKLREKYNQINEDRRQAFGEAAAFALGRYLQSKTNGSQTHVNATFISRNIFEPADALDTYGRFVGNIIVSNIDINLWLAREGWVIPTFYTSMSQQEITDILEACRKGRSKRRAWGGSVTYDCDLFKWDMVYRSPKEVDEFEAGSDKGDLLVPKLFRRVTNFRIERKAGLFSGSFLKFIEEKARGDAFHDLDEFIEHGEFSTPYRLNDFLNRQNEFKREIDEIIFREGPSTLKDENNVKVEKF
jgi:endonuclease YncB( thermonuclease family)